MLVASVTSIYATFFLDPDGFRLEVASARDPRAYYPFARCDCVLQTAGFGT
jgi:hypothetical protein